jgi:hypothetical protein
MRKSHNLTMPLCFGRPRVGRRALSGPPGDRTPHGLSAPQSGIHMAIQTIAPQANSRASHSATCAAIAAHSRTSRGQGNGIPELRSLSVISILYPSKSKSPVNPLRSQPGMYGSMGL